MGLTLPQASGVHSGHCTVVPALKGPTVQQGVCRGLNGGPRNEMSLTKSLGSMNVTLFGKESLQI